MIARLQRILRHRWLDESAARRAIPPALVQQLAERVAASERKHTGEIRIYVEAGLPLGYLWHRCTARDRAITLFGKLRVWDTEQNNGVLIYLLLAERAIEIVADRGVGRHVGEAQWQQLVQRMQSAFRAGRYDEGLLQAVDEVGTLLERHFPLAAGAANANELPDAPVLG